MPEKKCMPEKKNEVNIFSVLKEKRVTVNLEFHIQ